MIKVILIVISLFLFIWAFAVEPNFLTVKEYVIKDKDLAGLKIVYAADFHVGKKILPALLKQLI